jgi:serine/threonine protein kinase
MTEDRRTKADKGTNVTSEYTPGAADATQGFTVSPAPREVLLAAPPGYEVLGVIGRGGMGVVYRATQLSLNRVVALKTIALGAQTHTSAAARFEQEAQTIARLQHPHIVAAYDFGRHEGRLFLAMEFVEGQTLEELIYERGRLDEATTWGLIRQAAAGLAHAARFGIVHRDIKPANMLLVSPPAGFSLPANQPMLKLTDFGLAFLVDDRRDGRLTMEGTTLGSPHYMAPEQVTGAAVDARTDIYGLGATAYHMLTGSPPFPGDTVGQVLARKLKGETPTIGELVGDVSLSTRQLVERMMNAEMASRPADYAELLSLVDHLEDGAPFPPPRVAATKRDYKKWATALLAMVLFVAGAVAVSRFVSAFISGHRSLPTATKYVTTGWAAPLFDGSTLRGWMTKSGGWSHSQDAEGGDVIQGKDGEVRRTLPQPDRPQPHRLTAYRLIVSCDLATATAAELQFGFCAKVSGARLVLRMEKAAYRLGLREADKAPFVELASTPRTAEEPDPDNPHYHELRVERDAERWLAFADGKPFADADPLSSVELTDVGLAVEGGQALFDGPQVIELKKP